MIGCDLGKSLNCLDRIQLRSKRLGREPTGMACARYTNRSGPVTVVGSQR